jgi:multiple sugar transport system ATP-binding protein
VADPAPYLRLCNVVKSYDGRTNAVDDVSLDIARGEFITLLGPSGSGKTTTLAMVAGFETPTRGRIELDGHDLTLSKPYERNIGMVFQNYALFPHMTAEKNVTFPLKMRHFPQAEIKARAEKMLALVGLGRFAERYPRELSGGQQQRVALARGLVFNPDVLLLDEPLGALDKNLREQMQVEIKRIHREVGITMIYVTHDQTEAMTMASRIGVIEAGRLMQIGTPREIYENPINAHVAARLGQPAINLLPAEIFAGAPTGATTIGARTEHLMIAAGRGDVSATVRRVEHLGDQSHLHLDLGGQPIVTLSDPEARLGAGDVVSLRLNNPLFFDATGRRIAA